MAKTKRNFSAESVRTPIAEILLKPLIQIGKNPHKNTQEIATINIFIPGMSRNPPFAFFLPIMRME